MSNTNSKIKIDVLIVTAADGEDQAVKKVFGNGWERINPTPQINHYWHKITLTSKNGRRFTNALIRSDMGTDSAGPITQKMLDHLRPNFIAMCGICAGYPQKTKCGDVIIASKVFRYDRKSVTLLLDGSSEEKWDITTFSLAQSWWELAKLLNEDIPEINVHTAPMATGEALCRNPAVWDEIDKYERKCIGLEMEASVIGQIGHMEEKRWVVIKGVSDHASNDKDDSCHVLAKENAAKVLKEFLENVADQLPKIDAIDGVWIPPVVIGEHTVNPKNSAPSTLLHAKNEIVPFRDGIRRSELDALHKLCQSDNASHGIIQLFTGPGGIGKTRLMIEWVKRLKEIDSDWDACFLEQNIDPNSQNFKDIFSQDSHLFFVIDYAECRTNLSVILRVIIAAATEKPDRMVRVALIARHSDVWWQELSSNNLDIGSYLHERVVKLQNVPTQDNMRQYLFDEALQIFTKKTNGCSVVVKSNIYEMLSDTIFERVLYIHMAAYATAVSLNFTAQNLLQTIVNYEKHFWTISFREKFSSDQIKNKFIRETARVIAALTLFGGVNSDQKLMDIIKISKGPVDDLFLEFLRNFYPSACFDKIVGCLEPDLLGEYLVFETLSLLRSQKDPFTDATFITNIFNITEEPNELQQAFTVLGRIAEHDTCKNAEVRTMVEEWLSLPFDERHFGIRSIPAVGASISLAEKTAFCPIPNILTNALEKWGSVLLASEIWKILPSDSIAFRRLQLWIAETIWNDIKDKEHLTEEQQYDYAHAMLFYGTALFEVGQREEALVVTRKAVDTYRSLIMSVPDAFLPGLARSLNSLGNCLSELGQREEALEVTREAVNTYRLFAVHTDVDLLGSINNLGSRLIELGRYEEALELTREVEDTYRSLAEKYPDTYLPHLAMSLHNRGNDLNELGCREEALKKIRESVDIYKTLTTYRPDAFLPYLADSLNSLSNSLSELGLHKEALNAIQEAVEIYRLLKTSCSDSFLPDFAMSLDNLGNSLCKNGLYEKALLTTKEAEDIYRSLYTSNHDIFLPDLARCLNNLGIRYCDLDRNQEALEAARESVDIYRSLAVHCPDVFILGLFRSLNTMGNSLSGLERYDEALNIANEAVNICRPLAKSRSDIYLPYLAGALNNLGNKLGDLDKNEEALEVIREAVDIYKSLITSYQDAFLPNLADSLYNLGITYNALERHEEALIVYNEVIQLVLPLSRRYPQVFEELLYQNLHRKIQALRVLGREKEILVEEMIKMEELAQKYETEE